MRKLNKFGQFNFEWIFALVAGAAILILAVYGATRIGNTQRYQSDTEVAKQIEILTNPLQAGFASGSYGKIIFNQEARINNKCGSIGFGRSEISVSTRSGVGQEWNDAAAATQIENKYIFSSSSGLPASPYGSATSQGKEFYVFSKPFYVSFKVADLTFLNSEKYCFVLSQNTKDIENELKGLEMENIKVGDINNCSADAIKVCFNQACNISVYGTCVNSCDSIFDEGYVEKDGQRFDYIGSLMYGAIFSDKSVYDCNVKRLIFRTGEIAGVYAQKAELMNARDCNTNLEEDMLYLSSLKNSSDLNEINSVAKNLEAKRGESCGLY